MESNDMKAMREALDDIAKYLAPIRRWTMPSKERKTRLTALFATVDTVYQKATAALAKPRRNCDMGTAEEQAKRLNEWCSGRHCVNCQFKGGWPDECKLRWAQMPYEEGENK